eukprot:CAMPEP_0181247716 /NCGR_PEP_ID=MMETSP1096-20121128/44766_1 /TAXON_ID=156174 ORGANISM="Chrysochromulina ericina, Strain CCMP281" /NCGR_SAMPLE_ID=MMETSP1096 /ASSEMBLY_ACC=CAM_ASM_000453 /LENGTH=316 /DNA_ID=CAMNT_0023344799 /DNA_START=30 /DNA_END=981 /DNA_ORIENTATION=+
MGWGRRWGGGYRKSATSSAASLSTSTLQRILQQQQAEERRQQEYYVISLRMQKEREQRAAEEQRLEAEHGGKEGLANGGTKLEQERIAKAQAERKAAAEKVVVDELAALRAELAQLPEGRCSSAPNLDTLELNKSQAKTQFHLNERELEALPKNVVMKEGGKRPSKIAYSAHVIFEAVKAKAGKVMLRTYQQQAFPALARTIVASEITKLEMKHPELVEKGRATAVAKLVSAHKEAGQAVEKARGDLARAQEALAQSQRKRERTGEALREVATVDELLKHGVIDEGTSPHTENAAKPTKKQRTHSPAGTSSGLLVD